MAAEEGPTSQGPEEVPSDPSPVVRLVEFGILQVQSWSWNLLRSPGTTRVGGSAKSDVGLARAPLLVGAQSWDLTPWSGNQRSLVCKGRLWVLLGHFSWSMPSLGTLLRSPGTNVCKGRLWVLLGHLFWSVPSLGTLLRSPGTNGVSACKGRVDPVWACPILVGARSWDLTLWFGYRQSSVSARADFVDPVRARPILVGALLWDFAPRSRDQRSWCLQGQSGSYSGTSNTDRRPIMGPNSVVRGPTELSVCEGGRVLGTDDLLFSLDTQVVKSFDGERDKTIYVVPQG
uniref:Uncharacterized protein n=1 Tax=Ficus carica TaxID=3494 RepID=A0AA88CQ43_FICCA|nr:hypothetical protein TIFTF001_044453 [Ficus carica]GMN30357.1 hypothetical protein TIFTF001_044466 [Ficus carica]